MPPYRPLSAISPPQAEPLTGSSAHPAQQFWRGLRLFGELAPDPLLVKYRALELLPRFCRELETGVLVDDAHQIPTDLEVLLASGRPTPLTRADQLSRESGFAGALWLKREDAATTGSHKSNAALPACYYAVRDGVARIVSYSLAGNWAYAVAHAARTMELRATILVSTETAEYRPHLVANCRALGAEVLTVKRDHECDLAETLLAAAVALVTSVENARLVVGCHGNHPIVFQSVIGQEVVTQAAAADISFGHIIAASAGGTSAVGLMLPFIAPSALAPVTLTIAEAAGYSLHQCAQKPEPPTRASTITAAAGFSGLNTVCRAPALRKLLQSGTVRSLSIGWHEAREAASTLLRTEGIECAEETGYAIAAALRAARSASNGSSILVCVSGGPDSRSFDASMAMGHGR